MKTKVLLIAMAGIAMAGQAQNVIRVNQIGYLPEDIKAAVYMGDKEAKDLKFELTLPSAATVAVDSVVAYNAWAPFKASARVYFTSATTQGVYTLTAKNAKTGKVVDKAEFYIGDDAYSRYSVNELPLHYLRQQRCGYNPIHEANCHVHDGYVVLSDSLEGVHFDVTGGWHDASDYLQYLPTSAHTVFQLLFAYREAPEVWADEYDARGHKGANGIPDILDEARWGLEWMQKMNPRDGIYFNQIADDRDHRYAGVPQKDNVDYGWGEGGARPVYPVCGKPYGLSKYRNRSNGEASSVAKFASSFALGSSVFADIDAAFAADLAARAEKAFDYALAHPGAAQTASTVSPYFYEEDNWVDDVELAAAALYRLNGKDSDFAKARAFGSAERYTPWMGADTANHYQWYPFINIGHYEASVGDKKGEFASYYREGLSRVAARGADNVYLFGVPFVWCSNNFTTALVMQAMLYREMTGDDSFVELETSARDWLFGVNPWGQTMIVMPNGMVKSSPQDCHSAMSNLMIGDRPGRDFLIGGLVDGPVYTNIFNSLQGVTLRHEDRFAPFQNPLVVYHDDYSDYSTNEPTMDGTAALSYMLARLCRKK